MARVAGRSGVVFSASVRNPPVWRWLRDVRWKGARGSASGAEPSRSHLAPARARRARRHDHARANHYGRALRGGPGRHSGAGAPGGASPPATSHARGAPRGPGARAVALSRGQAKGVRRVQQVRRVAGAKRLGSGHRPGSWLSCDRNAGSWRRRARRLRATIRRTSQTPGVHGERPGPRPIAGSLGRSAQVARSPRPGPHPRGTSPPGGASPKGSSPRRRPSQPQAPRPSRRPWKTGGAGAPGARAPGILFRALRGGRGRHNRAGAPGGASPPGFSSLERLEAHNSAFLALAHAAFVQQDVGVAEHLAQREVGLGHGDVAP